MSSARFLASEGLRSEIQGTGIRLGSLYSFLGVVGTFQDIERKGCGESGCGKYGLK